MTSPDASSWPATGPRYRRSETSATVGHGEEALIVHRHGDEVRLTIRSLTRAAPQQPWRALYPLLVVAQRIVRRRYLCALR